MPFKCPVNVVHFKSTPTMKKKFTAIIAVITAAILTGCGGKDDPTIDEPIVETFDPQDTIQWLLQDTSVVPLIKRIIDYSYGDGIGCTKRDVFEFNYIDGKISREWEKREVYNENTGEWEMEKTYAVRCYTYSKDTVICKEATDITGKTLYGTCYYFTRKNGLTKHYTIIPAKEAWGRRWDYDFLYTSDAGNTTFFNWKNGNIESTTNAYPEYYYGILIGMTPNRSSFHGIIESAVYDTTHVNPFYYFDNMAFLGRNSKGLIIKKNNITFTYEWNDRGFPTKVIERYATGSTYVICYEYY
jgi:hypothetical protein